MHDLKNIPFINQINQINSFSLRVSLLIISDTRALMVRNEGKTKYKHVGGHVQMSESLSLALKREFIEEIGNVILEIPSNPSFFDQVRVEGNLMINSYFVLKVDDSNLENLSRSSKLPSNLFRFDELNNKVTFESEINALNFYLSL